MLSQMLGTATAAAAGVSLRNISATQIDLTDGSWTLLDPDSLIDSVTFGAGYNTITWNALAAGSSNYNWGAGSTHRAPRWYRLLQIDATQITNVDHLILASRIENDGTVNDFDQQVVVGAALDPTSTTATTIDGSGGLLNKTVGGTPSYGTWQVNAQTSGGNANNEYGIATVLRAGNSLGGGAYVALDSSDVAVLSGARASNQNAAAVGTVNVYLMVGVGTAASNDVITAGNQQKFRAHVTTMTLEVI